MDPATPFIELIKEQMRLVAELRAENVRLSAYAKEQEERLAEALDTIKLLKRRLYSASRERYIADPAIRATMRTSHPQRSGSLPGSVISA